MSNYIKEEICLDINKLVEEVGRLMIKIIYKILIFYIKIKDEMCLGLIGNYIFSIKIIIWIIWY